MTITELAARLTVVLIGIFAIAWLLSGGMKLLEGFPVYTECPCGCGLETYVGREPAITKEDAAKLMEDI